MAVPLHHDGEIAMSSVIGFMVLGKAMEWFSGHADMFAAVSYVLGAVAAIVTIYYKIKNKGK